MYRYPVGIFAQGKGYKQDSDIRSQSKIRCHTLNIKIFESENCTDIPLATEHCILAGDTGRSSGTYSGEFLWVLKIQKKP